MTETTTNIPGVICNDGGMLFVKENEPFGHLMHFDGHGVYDPNYGRVDIDPALVDAHNKILDEAYLLGLDNNCEVGQGGFFYLTRNADTTAYEVTTFGGVVVSPDVTVTNSRITFRRKGKTFTGRIRKDDQSFNFKRSA
jgi:hypothetical protein